MVVGGGGDYFGVVGVGGVGLALVLRWCQVWCL